MMCATAPTLVCTVKFVKSDTGWQHCFDIDANFLLYPLPLSVFQFRSKCYKKIHVSVTSTSSSSGYFP